MPETTPPTPPVEPEPALAVPEGICKARAHLRADLPALLASRRTRGKWALYSKDGRVKIGPDYRKLIDEVVRRDIPDGEYVIERVEAGAGSEEEDEIDSFGV
ncbi:MAG TPA: hypothetical protein VKD90_00175 [Gemmataceae bacterium]|nr:hypothetical protein [Gemmataceae bacterium]